jgi:hypothetical protein
MNEYMFYLQLHPVSVLEIFQKNNILFPRRLRIEVLRDIVESKIQEELKMLKVKKTNTDVTFLPKETKRLIRLQEFPKLSEVQLENELEYFYDTVLNISYYNLLWEKLIKNLKERKQEEVLDALNQLTSSEEIDEISVFAYNKSFNDLFVDAEKELDGISIQDIKKLYLETSNRKEAKRLAKKFNVTIPVNKTKSFVQTKLLQVLKDKNKLNDELTNKINNGTLKSLKLIMKDLDMSPQDLLSLSEIIEIIIEGSKNKKIKLDAVISTIQKEPKEESTILYDTIFHEILTNQKLILKNLQTLNGEKKDAIKKKKIDTIFNVVVITLIVIVVAIWVFYAITPLLA